MLWAASVTALMLSITNAANCSSGELRHIAVFEELSGAHSCAPIHQALFMATKQGHIQINITRKNSLNASAR